MASRSRTSLSHGGVAQPIVGAISPWAEPGIIVVAATAGVAVVVLDAEHGLIARRQVLAAVLEARRCGVALWIRAAGKDPATVAGYLDLGVEGIVIPHVSTAMEAEALAAAVHYPPRGRRGIGPTIDNSYFLLDSPSSYMEAVNPRIQLFLQIEDPEGAANAGAIASVDGVDGVLIGPRDLAAAMGYADTDHPEVLQVIREVAASVRGEGKKVALPVPAGAHPAVEPHVVFGYLPHLLHQSLREYRNVLAGGTTP